MYGRASRFCLLEEGQSVLLAFRDGVQRYVFCSLPRQKVAPNGAPPFGRILVYRGTNIGYLVVSPRVQGDVSGRSALCLPPFTCATAVSGFMTRIDFSGSDRFLGGNNGFILSSTDMTRPVF